MTLDLAKKAAGYKALEWIQDQMVVGLGTGSTTAYFIEALISACKKGLKVHAVASSKKSQELATCGGILVHDLNEVSQVDITVDGADEIDAKRQMIKGGGGAHVREKILAMASHKVLIIVDETKVVSSIGHTKLPVEIIPYGAKMTEKKIQQLGFQGAWRLDSKENLFITDNQNLILDIYFQKPPESPEKIHESLKTIAGVVETGFFFHLAHQVVVGRRDGSTYLLK